MKSTGSFAVRVCVVSAGCGMALTLAAKAVPAPVVARDHAQSAIDPATILPPLRQPVRALPVSVSKRALFELTLRTDPKADLAQQLQRAGATTEDATRVAALLRTRLGADLETGADFKLGLGPKTPTGARSIETVAFITDIGMERIERLHGELTAIAPTAARRVSARIDGGAYWSLRTAGLDPELAAEAAKLAENRLGAARDGVILAVVGERPARFGSGSVPRLLLVAVERKGQPVRRLMAWPGAPGRWVDPDRPAALAAAFVRPVAGRVTSVFGTRLHPILRFLRPHRGIDFAARAGAPVLATADGCVVGAGWSGGYGRQVRLAHRDGLASSYSHLARLEVRAGQCVRRGELVGLAGASGLATGPHLHFELHRGGQAVDPERVLSAPADIDIEQRAAIAARLGQIRGTPIA